MLSDPISDMLIRLKNAALVGQTRVIMPASELKLAIAETLKQAGFIKSLTKKGKKVKKVLELELAYVDGLAKLHDIKRVSKPSRRAYVRASAIKPVRYGYGFGVYSTPRGILTDKAARQAKVGGEFLFKIW